MMDELRIGDELERFCSFAVLALLSAIVSFVGLFMFYEFATALFALGAAGAGRDSIVLGAVALLIAFSLAMRQEYVLRGPVLRPAAMVGARCCEFSMLVGAPAAVLYSTVERIAWLHSTAPLDKVALILVCFAPGLVLWCWACFIYKGKGATKLRHPRGCCELCGYDLTGIQGSRCPECGEGV